MTRQCNWCWPTLRRDTRMMIIVKWMCCASEWCIILHTTKYHFQFILIWCFWILHTNKQCCKNLRIVLDNNTYTHKHFNFIRHEAYIHCTQTKVNKDLFSTTEKNIIRKFPHMGGWHQVKKGKYLSLNLGSKLAIQLQFITLCFLSVWILVDLYLLLQKRKPVCTYKPEWFCWFGKRERNNKFWSTKMNEANLYR